ncbi:MAG: hypothetical protein A2103_03120 [Gammaproteobacteria bacterium GWF2_41_13]|nr:MAG: hypothetical protein A2103_03120 [Gammaproteobacteria bacterium GWF2_41_13]
MRSIFPANARQEAELDRCVRMMVQEGLNRIEEDRLPTVIARSVSDEAIHSLVIARYARSNLVFFWIASGIPRNDGLWVAPTLCAS